MTQPTARNSRLPLASAMLAATLGFCAATAQATPDQGRAALDAQLADFASQALKPSSKIKTTLSASSADLITAICAVLLNPANTISAADLAAGALLAVGSEVRADKDAIAGQIVDAAIRASDAADTSGVSAIVSAVAGINSDGNNSTTGATELKSSGKAAAVAAALKLATSANAGNTIAQQVLPLIVNGSEASVQKFARNTLNKVGASTAQVQGFVDGIFDHGAVPGGNRVAFTTALARSIVANKAAAGATIGSLAVDTPAGANHDSTIQAAAIAAIADPLLAPATAEIVAAIARQLDGTITDPAFATAVATGQTANSKGQIAAGIISAASDTGTVAILNAVLAVTTNPIIDKAKFAGSAAKGNGGGLDTKLEKIAQTLGASTTLETKEAIGTQMVKSLGATHPADSARVYSALTGITTGTRVEATTTRRVEFGIAILGGTTSSAAVGAIAKAVAGDLTNDDLLVAGIFLNKYTSAATGIAQRISELVSVADKALFAKNLAGKNTALASAVAVGVSITDPANAEDIVLATTTFNKTTKAAAATIAGAVAKAVDVEKAADIGAILASSLGAGGLKLSQASSIAAAIAKSIQKKPGVTTANRADELGEVAATIVRGILGKSTSNSAEVDLIGSIGKSILKALPAKGVPNNINLKADQRAAADIAGSIAQTISLSTLTAARKAALLAADGKLAATLTAAVGAKYAASVAAAIAEVLAAGPGVIVGASNPNAEPIGTGGIPAASATQRGKYEIGSINDPETPKKNL